MATSIHFVTTPTADTPGTTLMLTTPRKHYVFGNEAEGTQRAMTEMGYRLTKVQEFFVTGKTEWKNTGGLMGMALTLADSSATAYASQMESWRKALDKGKDLPEPPRPEMNIFGPPNLKHMLATCRRFIFRKGLPIIATEYKPSEPRRSAEGDILPAWTDDNIQVWALSIAPEGTGSDDKEQAEAQRFSRAAAHFDTALNTFESQQPVPGESEAEREDRYDRIRTSVINAMFDSKWNFDTLVERHISEIQMPTAIFIRNASTKQLEPYKGPVPGGQEPLPDIQVLTRTPWPGATILNLPPTKPAPESVSYIVRSYSARGKFDIDRAKELGVKPGKAYSRLTSGESVLNEAGETITPDMVLGPVRPGQGAAILDVPSVAHLEKLVLREELHSDSVMQGVRACIWILGPGVSSHPLFAEITRKLSQCQHVVSSVDVNVNRLALDYVAKQTIRLGEIDPDRYRVPFHDNETLPQRTLLSNGSQKESLPEGVVPADRGVSLRLMPKYEFNPVNQSPHVNISEIRAELPAEISTLAREAHEEIERDAEALQAWRKLLARSDTEVITLGTGSALPSKYRNVSSTLVRVPGIGNYLFDSGENTIGQLQRVFGPDELVDVLRNLRIIWISHLHADHHLGTASVIKAWYQVVYNGIPADAPPSLPAISENVSQYGLSVISHDGMLKWLSEYASIEDFGYSRILPLQLDTTLKTNTSSTLTLWPSRRSESYSGEHTLKPEDYETVLGVSKIQACRVAHCFGAMAVSLTFPPEPNTDPNVVSPLKISYSGDCRPSAKFAAIGKDTTVLIHEATFDDELQGDAVVKKHSTTSEALGIGARMGAKAVVLTHFSQRYQKIPVLQTISPEEDGDANGNGSGSGVLLDDKAMEDVSNEQIAAEANLETADQDDLDIEDPTSANADMTSLNLPSSSQPALPSNAISPGNPHHQHEQVIKIRANTDMKVAVAFDYMRVKIGDIAKLERFNRALNRLLVVDDDDDDGTVRQEGEGDGSGVVVNKNGKKSSPLGGGGGGKKKKSRRNN